MDEPRIVDREGRQRDWSWLSATFGAISLERAEVPEGTAWAYRIVELRESEGPAAQVVKVCNREDSPLEGVTVVRHWPDAPLLPHWAPPASQWRDRGVYGKTNAEGDIGFGMGRGDYYFPPAGGASSVWVADAAGPSDLIGGLGMLGGTNHRHLDVYYQLEGLQQPAPPPPPPQPGFYIVDQSGKPQDLNWLERYFGILEHHQAPEPAAYRLIELRAVEESQEQKITVLDEEGKPQSGVPVSFRRRDGTGGHVTETGADGTARFSLESDAKYPVPGQGPYLAVIKSEAGSSDAAIGLGRVLGTPRHLDVKFRFVRGEVPPNPPPPPPPPPPSETVDKEWEWLFDRLDRIIAILEDRVG